jgi:hypothetical protein
MFKKIEIWILYLFIFLGILFAIGTGVLVRQDLVGGKLGVISKGVVFLAEIPRNLNKYLGFDLRTDEQRFFGIKGFQGNPLEEEIYLLLSKYDGDIGRSVVELIDLRSFEVKKTWRPDIKQINRLVDNSLPEFENIQTKRNARRYRMFHPLLTEDGGLVFQHLSPLVKIDKNSQLVWQNQEDIFHHSIEQDHEGNLWIPTAVYPYQIDKKYVGLEFGNFYDDAITKVSADGKILFQKSVSNILLENNLKCFVIPCTVTSFLIDPIHLNDIQPILTDGPHWKRGDVFLSMLTTSTIVLYRPSTNKVIWKGGQGHISGQHDVDILDDHRISIFNNNRRNSFDGDKLDGHNEVVIYDFKTDSYSKYLDESLEKNDVRTIWEGLSEILDNGDLFIEEQNFGRLLFINKDTSLQWQYVNRADDGKVYLVSWSRILYKPEDVKKVRKVIETEN